MRTATILLSFAISTAALASGSNSITPTADHATYSRLYPTHVEYCAGTEFQPIVGPAGGAGGHGFTYIRGLCRDFSKSYPAVKVCDGSEDHDGVGVSVNSDFKNVNFVVIPSYEAFLNGELHEGETVDAKVVDRISQRAAQSGWFRNILIKPELTTGLKYGTPEYEFAVAKNSLGTDFGIRYARSLECARLPIRKEALPKIASVLNTLNSDYFAGYQKDGKTYDWSGLKNNCAHVASEILEAAGIRRAIPKNLPTYESIFHIALPRNGVYTLLQIGLFRSTTGWKVFKRETDRESLTSTGPWMATEVGVLAKKYPQFKDNSVFGSSTKASWMIPKDLSGFSDARAAFNSPQAKYSEIGANLLDWEKRYLELSNDLTASLSAPTYYELRIMSGGVYGSKAYDQFEPFYARYASEQLKFVQQSLTSLGLKGISN